MLAADLPGKFEGVTVDAKLIGGQQYEALYARIAEWEKATGAKVNVLSKKNHFELDKEIKSDIATGNITWCVGSNHSSFAPQYPDIYTDLSALLPKEEIDAFVPANIASSTLDGKLVMLPRAQFDVSALYYQKSLYQDDAEEGGVQGEIRLRSRPAGHLAAGHRPSRRSSPIRRIFTARNIAGKEEAINGRFYEMLVAEGGEYLGADGKPAFNSDAGVRALDWFVNLYKAKAVPVGTTNYLWDDLGQGFASGTIAVNLDWPGWASFFNDPKSSKVAGNVGVKVAAGGFFRQAHRLVRSPRFLGHGKLRQQGSRRLACLVPHQRGQPEAGILCRPAADAHGRLGLQHQAGGKRSRISKEVLTAFQEAAKHAFAVPQTPSWIEISNAVYPELQAAILGDKTSKEALDAAAEKATQILEDAGAL
ncbi:ABC transporter substrate-binding protein [Shinella sp.]|uniref:ABC transporter substrate-binding protein n=1 Tax=Shinella sp. TaxID=1870904 RepID=UPI003D2A5D2B